MNIHRWQLQKRDIVNYKVNKIIHSGFQVTSLPRYFVITQWVPEHDMWVG